MINRYAPRCITVTLSDTEEKEVRDPRPTAQMPATAEYRALYTLCFCRYLQTYDKVYFLN